MCVWRGGGREGWQDDHKLIISDGKGLYNGKSIIVVHVDVPNYNRIFEKLSTEVEVTSDEYIIHYIYKHSLERTMSAK